MERKPCFPSLRRSGYAKAQPAAAEKAKTTSSLKWKNMPKKKPKKGKPEVHKDLKGFEIKINEFGEIITNFEVDKLNVFLNENVEDKKFRERDTEELEENRDDEEE